MKAELSTRSTRAQLLEAVRSVDRTEVEKQLGLSADRLSVVKSCVAPEDWGDDDAVLHRYLALHIPLAIEQGRYVWNGKEIVMRAGHLATASGAPVYLGLAPPDWSPTWAGERPSTVEALLPTDLGPWPVLDQRREVVVACEVRESVLGKLSPILQSIVVAGAVEWSIRRGLATRHLHRDTPGYFAPIHLSDRDGAPELVAAIQVQSNRNVVRALLEPRPAYGPARVVAERRDQVPRWLLDAWSQFSNQDT